MSDTPRPTAPGWYGDPNAPGQVRWWDGSSWTEHTSPGDVVTAAAVAPTDAATPPAHAQPRPLDYPIRMRPLTSIRVTNAIGTIAILGAGAIGVWGGFAIGTFSHQGWIISAISAPFAIYGLVLLVTASRLEIVLTKDQAIVRGYSRTVRIPRDSITEITAYPRIAWTDDRGNARKTPVNALSLYRSGRASPNPTILARVGEQWAVLRDWAARTD
jgi:hypothetical protein